MEDNYSNNQPLKMPERHKERMWQAASIFAVVMFLIFAAAAAWVYIEMKNRPAGYGLTALGELSRRLSKTGEENIKTDVVRPRKIDGVMVEPGQENIAPVAVVIDNHPDSRPPAGLGLAQLVYEAEAEGGLTRYLAFYAGGEEIKEIGPVRSARPYFLDWAAEFGAVLSHCGGSPEALARLQEGEVTDMNEFYEGEYFWRSDERAAPHNVMTSSELLNKYLAKEEKGKGDYFSWQFAAETATTSTATSSVNIKKYTVEWVYDNESGDYIRALGGKIHADADGKAIKAKNVIVMFAEMTVLDELLRLEIKTLGQDRAIVCLSGECGEGEWRKPSKTSRTRFYNNEGNEFIFNPGATWIEVVSLDAEVVY
jgi:hypothetical protein